MSLAARKIKGQKRRSQNFMVIAKKNVSCSSVLRIQFRVETKFIHIRYIRAAKTELISNNINPYRYPVHKKCFIFPCLDNRMTQLYRKWDNTETNKTVFQYITHGKVRQQKFVVLYLLFLLRNNKLFFSFFSF